MRVTDGGKGSARITIAAQDVVDVAGGVSGGPNKGAGSSRVTTTPSIFMDNLLFIDFINSF